MEEVVQEVVEGFWVREEGVVEEKVVEKVVEQGKVKATENRTMGGQTR